MFVLFLDVCKHVRLEYIYNKRNSFKLAILQSANWRQCSGLATVSHLQTLNAGL